MSSIRLKPGLCGGLYKALIPYWLSHDLTTFQQCFGSLSCWNIPTSGKLSALSAVKLFLKMSLYILPFIMPLICTSEPTPEAVKQPQTMIEASSCLIVFFRYFGFNCLLAGRRTYYFTSLRKTLNFVVLSNHMPKIRTFVNMPCLELNALFHILVGPQWFFLRNASIQLKFV